MTVRLLCNGERVGVDLKELTAFQAGGSVEEGEWEEETSRTPENASPDGEDAERAYDARESLLRDLEDTEAEVDRLEKAIEGILEENRSLNSRRKLQRERFRAEKDRIIERNKGRKRKDWEDLPNEADDPAIRRIDVQLAQNSQRLRPEQEALDAANARVKRINLMLRKMDDHPPSEAQE